MIVHIEKRFELLRDDGTTQAFMPGFHDVSDDDAEHWYLKAHIVGAEPVIPAAGTHEYALMMLDRAAKAKEAAAKAAEMAEAAELAAKTAADAIVSASLEAAPEPEPQKTAKKGS